MDFGTSKIELTAIPPTMRLCSRYFFCFFSAILQFTFFITHAQSVILETSAMKDGTEYGLLNVKKRKVAVSEVGEFKKSLTERGELARSFHATRVSPSGAIVVDDNLGLFIAGDDPMPQYARRTADIEKFKLVIDRNWEDSTTDSLYVNGGHIEITLNELLTS